MIKFNELGRDIYICIEMLGRELFPGCVQLTMPTQSLHEGYLR